MWSLVFAAPHTWWALGISAGFPGGEAKYHFFMSSTWRYVFDLVVIFLSVLAALVALTLLTAPQRSVWRRLAHVAAWIACGMLTLRGVAGFIHDGFSDRIWNPTFFIGGILYGGVALLAHRNFRDQRRCRQFGLTARFGYRRTIDARIIELIMQIPFQITALPIETFCSLLNQTDEDLQAVGARRMVADKNPGFPCRVSLVDAEPGEEVLLIPFTHHDVKSPYRATGPIFVRVKAQTAKLEVNEIPQMILSRLLSIRGYDSDGMMLISDVVNGSELETHLRRFFADPSVEYIHIHNARPGCYNCRVDRV